LVNKIFLGVAFAARSNAGGVADCRKVVAIYWRENLSFQNSPLKAKLGNGIERIRKRKRFHLEKLDVSSKAEKKEKRSL
jgi:hypothetical protein